MALGTFTLSDEVGVMPSAPTFTDRIHFLGDSTYPSGGTPGFKALFNALTKDKRTPIAVIAQDCGGYQVTYDETLDKLKVWQGAGTHAPLEENTTADLSAITFNVIVISK